MFSSQLSTSAYESANVWHHVDLNSFGLRERPNVVGHVTTFAQQEHERFVVPFRKDHHRCYLIVERHTRVDVPGVLGVRYDYRISGSRGVNELSSSVALAGGHKVRDDSLLHRLLSHRIEESEVVRSVVLVRRADDELSLLG